MGIIDTLTNSPIFKSGYNGVLAANETRKIVFNDPKLFIFPIFSTVLVILEFVITFVLFIIGALATAGLGIGFWAFLVYLFVFYIISNITTTYVLMAMLIAFREYLKGNKIGLLAALSQTLPYTLLVIEWAIFYSVIVVLLEIAENAINGFLRGWGPIGQIIAGIIDAILSVALAVATVFAVQAILDEKIGPLAAVKESISFIKKNFAATFGGFLYADIPAIIMSWIGWFLIIVGVLAIIASWVSVSPLIIELFGNIYVSATIIVIGILFLIAGGLFKYVMFNCFKLIVFDYYNDGTIPKGFDKSVIQAAIKTKTGQGGAAQSGGKPSNQADV